MILESRIDDVRREFLDRTTRGHGTLLHEVEQYATQRLGKMLRPRMLLAAADTLGEADSQRTLMLAVCVEMIHNASLIHDDIIDHADTRRGQDSVNHRWSNAVAVLVGDYLLAQTTLLINEVGDPTASKLLNQTMLQMVESELLQQEILGHRPMTRDDYLTIIDGKTARLFATAAALGNPAYEEYGLHYGRLFQLRDDLADNEDTPFTQSLIKEEEAALKETLDKNKLQPLVL